MRGRTRSSKFQKAAGLAVYEQIADKIRLQLTSGKFAEGSKMPGIREISEAYDVNYLTARQAFKHLEGLGLIQMQTGRGTYVTSRESQPIMIGVVVPDLGYKVNAGISHGIRAESHKRNVISVFMDFHNEVDIEAEYYARLTKEKFAGAVVYPSLDEDTPRQLWKMLLKGFPLVFIDRAPSEIPCWLISSDDYEIGRLAARHLIESGARVLGCVGDQIPNVRERVRGFCEQANDLGIAVPSSRIMGMATVPPDETKFFTSRLMELKPRPDGIFYFNDQFALVGLRQLHDLRIRVPGEVRIVGCDDIEAAQHSWPTLTSIRQDSPGIGLRAFQLLTEMLALPPEERLQRRHLRQPVELVARESTGMA